MELDKGEKIFQHYEKHFDRLGNVRVYEKDHFSTKIQILEFPDTIPGCNIYTSLGLSKYDTYVKNKGEIYTVVDNADDVISKLLAESIFFLVSNKMTLGRGTAISGLGNIDIEFTKRWNKSVLYLTLPFNCPPGFDIIDLVDEKAYMMLAFFITENEYQYYLKYGAEKLEDLFQKESIDPYSLSRKSAV